MKQLDMLVERIETREELVEFIRLLQKDLINNPEGWENDELASYLEAMAGWVDDMDGYYQNRGSEIPQTLSWKHVGYILLASKTYE